MRGKIVGLSVACKDNNAASENLKKLFFFVFQILKATFSTPANFIKFLWRNLKDITAADKIQAKYKSSKIIQKVFGNKQNLTKLPCTFN